MTDHTKATGSGTMMIRDTGTNVELWIIAGSSSTWINGATYGGSWSGTFNYPSGGSWLKIRTVDVNSNMTVTFTLNATGTSGLGGPTTLSAAITRVVVPPAPDPVTFSSITTTSVYTTFYSNGTGGGATTWQLARNTSNTLTGATIVASDGTLSVTGLAKGDVYYFWARGHNSAGYGPWSSVRSMTTLAVPPAPDPVVLSAITNQKIHTVFYGNGNGVGTFLRWELGYGTSSATPQTIVTSNGTLDLIGLTPGTTYYFWARGINSTGTGLWSARTTATLIAGAWVDVAGVKKRAVPYVRVAGVWKVAEGWAKIAGLWKASG